MTKVDVYDFVASHKLGVLGSISPDGFPQSALVGIAVTPNLEIIFDTISSSRKYRNLAANPKASFVIGWSGEVTVQFEGEAFLPEPKELPEYQNMYFARWPECRTHRSWPGICYFVVRPNWIRYSDYDQKPALIQEFTF
jgi:pyridoxine/pyridoxamine 5'-phosphate oxidase